MSNVNGGVYYGGGTGNITELANQLYWRGSIASRNTIAGAGQQSKPEGVSCESADTLFTCAQRYDLDYLRRFTPVIDSTNGNFTRIANNGLFSGGGSCDPATGRCSLGLLPSVIKLDADQHINTATSQTATVYVEKDTATVNNPPPGFSIISGLESQQEIR